MSFYPALLSHPLLHQQHLPAHRAAGPGLRIEVRQGHEEVAVGAFLPGADCPPGPEVARERPFFRILRRVEAVPDLQAVAPHPAVPAGCQESPLRTYGPIDRRRRQRSPGG
jgi:hypothetical protein